MSEIKAIETVYNGYRFRSRLEARWAVFFNAGNIRYEYEPEGYEIKDNTFYLPDFYLPQFDLHVEVKRDTKDGIQEIKDKCVNAISWGGPIKQILILSEVPEGRSVDGGLWHFPVLYWKADAVEWGWWFFHDLFTDDGGVDGNISRAQYINSDWHIEKTKSIKAVSDNILRIKNSISYPMSIEEQIEEQEEWNKETFKAYKAARQARFEHGETPVI